MGNTSNALFGFPNLADINPPASNWVGRSPKFLDGIGVWQPRAPLTNLQNRFFAYKCRSVNCNPSSTRFAVDLGSTQLVYAVIIPRHNLSPSATMKVSLFADGDAVLSTSIISDTVNVVPRLPWGSIAFGSPDWFTGQVDPETAQYVPQPAMVIFSAVTGCRYVLVEIVDTANTNPYVELSRLFITPGYQPSVNIAWSAQMSVDDPTIVTSSPAGADFYDLRPKHRVFTGKIDFLPEQEAFGNIFLMHLRLGLSSQFFFSMYPQDTALVAFTSFVATLTKLDPLTAAAFGYQGVAFSIREVIA